MGILEAFASVAKSIDVAWPSGGTSITSVFRGGRQGVRPGCRAKEVVPAEIAADANQERTNEDRQSAVVLLTLA